VIQRGTHLAAGVLWTALWIVLLLALRWLA
jgi:hypothetical protein